jgi:hypothetical protein
VVAAFLKGEEQKEQELVVMVEVVEIRRLVEVSRGLPLRSL